MATKVKVIEVLAQSEKGKMRRDLHWRSETIGAKYALDLRHGSRAKVENTNIVSYGINAKISFALEEKRSSS